MDVYGTCMHGQAHACMERPLPHRPLLSRTGANTRGGNIPPEMELRERVTAGGSAICSTVVREPAVRLVLGRAGERESGGERVFVC